MAHITSQILALLTELFKITLINDDVCSKNVPLKDKYRKFVIRAQRTI